jgi:hypothetical protein
MSQLRVADRRLCKNTHDVKCSTDGSTGVVLRDLRNEESPGVTVAAPCAILSESTRVDTMSLCSCGRRVGASCCFVSEA